MKLGPAIFAAALVWGSLSVTRVRGEYPASTEIYGNSGAPRFATSIQIPSATYATPSEVRMAIHASGATPSELRANYNRIGPLTASGPISYVPYRPSVYEAISIRAREMNCIFVEVPVNAPPAPSDGRSDAGAPAPSALSPAANDFSTGAFNRNTRHTLALSKGFAGWMTSGPTTLGQQPATMWRPSSFSTPLLLEPLRAGTPRDPDR